MAFFTNSEYAYARCTEEEVKTGSCRLPDNNDASLASTANQNVSSSSSTTTAAMLQECSDLGIKQEKCSENEILKHRCLGGVGAPCGPSGVSQPELSPFVAEILAGSGVAFVASIFGIRKLRTIKKKRTTESNNSN